MPQEHQVVRCFTCSTFQVDIVKKSTNKWICKVCGEKQSLKGTYGISSSAKECREICQKLNEKRCELDEAKNDINGYDENEDLEQPSPIQHQSNIQKVGNKSRWAKYLIKPDDENQE